MAVEGGCADPPATGSIGRVTPHAARRRATVAAVIAAALAAARPAAADLRADELVLIVNRREPAGAELAAFYAQQRHVPDGRICTVDLPVSDDLPAKLYATQVVPQVRAFLHDHGLERQVRCLVPFYGVPLRISARQNTPPERAEIDASRATLIDLPNRIGPAVAAVEAVAKRLQPSFAPAAGTRLDDLDRRWATAAQVISAQLNASHDPARRADVARQFFVAAVPLLGRAADIKARALDLEQRPDRRPIDGPPLQADTAAYVRATADAAVLEGEPEDAAARASLRKAAPDTFGLLQYARLLRDQLDYLDERHGGQAFDSELAVVQWRVHPHNYAGGNPYAGGVGGARSAWFANPLSYASAAAPRPAEPPTLMVVRLDAPTPALAKAMIATSLRVEHDGLHGKIVIDALGSTPTEDPPGHKGYGPYDQTLVRLDQLLAGKPGVDVLFDDKPELLPAHSASDVALYVGWYNVGGYVPCCSFAGGAVAMHVASYTLVSLRTPGSTNWAAGLISDGAVATIGPVAEPYLLAFPRADDFFPLLMTGKLTLAECYWRTEPVVSWQMTCIGDPLYTPYRVDPQLAVADLPARLRGSFQPAPVQVKPPPVPGR